MKRGILTLAFAAVLLPSLSLAVFCDDKEEADEKPLAEAKELFDPSKFKDAIEKYRVLLQQEEYEMRADIHFNLGLLLYQTHDYTSAVKELSRTTELNRNDSRAYYYLGMTYEALSIEKDSKAEKVELRKEALKAWQNFVSLNNSSTNADKNDGTADMNKKNLDTANRHIRFLLRHTK